MSRFGVITIACLSGLSIAVAGVVHVADPSSPPHDGPRAAIQGMLKERCARCHQAGSHEGFAPAGRFGNVLALDELARDSRLVQPGNPDGSLLLAYLLDRRHPGGFVPGEPSPADRPGLRAVMEWIAALPTRPTCRARSRLTPGDISAAVESWLKVFSRKITRDTRFISLANLVNECATESEARGYREAVDKVLNGLSWREGPVRTRAIDGTGAILAVRLGDLGWDAARWDRLADAQPAGFTPEALPSVAQATGVRRPIIRADWLADVATRPPLYYELLDVPDTFEDFARRLRVAPDSAGASTVALSNASRVTGGRRTIERRAGPAGPVWIAHDYALQPSPPIETATTSARVEPQEEGGQPLLAGMRALFTLPNGFLGSAIFAPDGRRRERIASDLDASVSRALGPTVAGRACLACHASGVIPIAPDAAVGAARDIARQSEADRSANRTAMIRAGVDPDASLHGREVVDALAARYRADVRLGRVAAELGMDTDDLAARVAAVSGDSAPLAIRLLQDRLTRDEANTLVAQISANAQGSPAVVPPAPSNDGPPRINLTLTSDRAEYRIGDRPRFTIETNAPCYLTLISVNARGAATVLLPNDFDRDHAIKPGLAAHFPATTTHYDIRFMEPGRETVVALCEPAPEPPAGIVHKFAVERFTILGNWREFLAGGSYPRTRAGRGRRKRPRNYEAGTTATAVETPLAGGQTAIVIEVRK